MRLKLSESSVLNKNLWFLNTFAVLLHQLNSKSEQQNEIPFVTTEYFQKAKLSEYQNAF
jgi:hypothetical protein